MQSLKVLLHEAEMAHGHLCAGQILGVRMAMLGCRLLGIDEPRSGPDRKRLVTFVEIDRWATDAIAVVTGCRLGKRALKFRDWGKMAASFVDLAAPPLSLSPAESSTLTAHSSSPTASLPSQVFKVYRAIRIAALESSKSRARELYPHFENKNAQQMLAYRELPDDELFSTQWVSIPLHPREMPGYKSPRIACALCGEGINYDRDIVLDGRTLCQSCASPEACYYKHL
jgi:formylmethanofuran dehydrogenase subunit E